MLRTAIAQALQLGRKGLDQMTTLKIRNCRLAQARDPKQPVPYARGLCVRSTEQLWNRSLRGYAISILGDFQTSTRQSCSQPDLTLQTMLL